MKKGRLNSLDSLSKKFLSEKEKILFISHLCEIFALSLRYNDKIRDYE